MAANGDDLNIELVAMGLEPFNPLFVREQQLQAAVLNSINHFLARPPCIHGDGHCADRRDAHEGENPFGVVSKCDTDTIAWFYVLILELIRDPGSFFPGFLIGKALALVDEKVPV